jgi:hypothetical protein
MAASMLRCQNPDCRAEFVAARSHAKWCSEKCRKRFERRPSLYNGAEIDEAIRDTDCAEDALLVVLCRLELEAAA